MVMSAFGLVAPKTTYLPKLLRLAEIPTRLAQALQYAIHSWQFAVLSLSAYLIVIATIAGTSKSHNPALDDLLKLSKGIFNSC